uniref:NADH:ubiquinone reductase (H(+)-translocating) n=1 Tax=Cyathocotyle prussica TaxID=2067575 RepID=A0A6J3YMH2_9TREM|nr:NADH dehydrogenase subunit 5 [Cyathocotyle prussica]AYH51393.1 NADH dehydrogenase subunit 5 [Cyathocotyle prussica]
MFVWLCVLMVFIGLVVVDSTSFLSLSALLSPLSYPWGFMEVAVCVDYVSLIGIFMLIVCSALAFVYCFHYFSASADSTVLFILMVWFVGVMGLLMFSYSLVFSLIMWEYLGFVSFLLILFYSNMSSMRASLVTLFSSRFGDVALFGLLALCLSGCFSFGWFSFLCFIFIVVTKSASFPFISWLLEAMRAPTPVSSLVHSSTLVAAGVWFIVRYGGYMSDWGVIWIFVGSLLTVLITGVCAMFFVDLKKIVALSTCNNIGWCLIYYCCGDWVLVLFQLLVHGVSKCVLFMLVGDVMSASSGSQIYLAVYSFRYTGVYGMSLLGVLIFSLCGLPFMGIFFVKHLFLVTSLSCVSSLICLILLLFGFFISYVYSSRFMLILCSACSGLNSGFVVSFLLVSVVSFLGSFVGLICVNGLEELEMLSLWMSISFILIQLGGLFLGYLIYSLGLGGTFWDSVLWGNDSLVNGCYSMFSFFKGASLISFYRWEVAFVVQASKFVSGLSLVSLMLIFSFNFVVIGIVYSVFLGTMLY